MSNQKEQIIMKITSIRIKNFRGYHDEVMIKVDDLTVLIGKNDAGKSTILDMLDIFFNDEKKIGKDDVNKTCRANNDLETVFAVRFSDLPTEVDIDAGNSTTLQNEYLTIGTDEFEVVKRYKDGGKPKTFIRACHPNNPECCDLLKKKQADLRKMVDKLGIDCDKNKNSIMRQTIWSHFSSDLQIVESELDVDSKDSDVKAIWEKMQKYLPVYSLFKSDRSNVEKDAEVQDPLKSAVKSLMKEEGLFDKLDEISQLVKSRVEEVASRTLEKLKEMSGDVANTLHPVLPAPKWEDVFKGISITGDDDIPLDKRGSGVRRLILLNFFRAEVERRQSEKGAPNIIYAIEEPETSQHADFQRALINALKDLAKRPFVQVLITTHSSTIVKELSHKNLRMITNDSGDVCVCDVEKGLLPYVSLNEASYLAFDGEALVEYHDELYGHLQHLAMQDDEENYKEKKFDTWLTNKGMVQDVIWIRIEKNGEETPCNRTISTYVRNSIHHPENRKNTRYTIEQLKSSIERLRGVLASIVQKNG